MAMFNFTRKSPTEGYSEEDRVIHNSSVKQGNKAKGKLLGRTVLAGLCGFVSYCALTDLKQVPVEYTRLEKAQNYFDGLVSAIDNEPYLLNSMTNVQEVVEYQTQFGTQDFSKQREFARNAHYTLQRKIDELDFNKNAHDASNSFDIFSGLLFGYLTYSLAKKGKRALIESSNCRKQIKGLEEKYEKIAEEEKEKRRQNGLAEEAENWRGGH